MTTARWQSRELRPAREMTDFVWHSGNGIRYTNESWECQIGELPPLPSGTLATTLYLEVEEVDVDDDYLATLGDEDLVEVEWEWRFGVTEEVAGFGEATFGEGTAPSLAEAQRACVAAASAFVLENGWNEEQLARCLPVSLNNAFDL
jgi:hypothetical protein